MLLTLLLNFMYEDVSIDCLWLLRGVVVVHIYHVVIARDSVVIIEMVDLEGSIFFELLDLVVIDCDFRHLVSETVFALSNYKSSFIRSIDSVIVTLLSIKLRAVYGDVAKLIANIAFYSYFREVSFCLYGVLDVQEGLKSFWKFISGLYEVMLIECDHICEVL